MSPNGWTRHYPLDTFAVHNAIRAAHPEWSTAEVNVAFNAWLDAQRADAYAAGARDAREQMQKALGIS